MHTSGKRIRFADITSISVREQYKAGDWLHLTVGSKLVSKLNVSGTLFASPRLPQWQALREFMLMRMQSPMQKTQRLPREQLFQSQAPVPAVEARAFEEEHIAWPPADDATRLGQHVPIHQLKFRNNVS